MWITTRYHQFWQLKVNYTSLRSVRTVKVPLQHVTISSVIYRLKVRWMLPLVKQKGLTLHVHLSSPVCLRSSCCPIFSFLHNVLFAIACPFYFGRSIVCSLNDGFWLHLGYLQISLILISQKEKPMYCHIRGSQCMRW